MMYVEIPTTIVYWYFSGMGVCFVLCVLCGVCVCCICVCGTVFADLQRGSDTTICGHVSAPPKLYLC